MPDVANPEAEAFVAKIEELRKLLVELAPAHPCKVCGAGMVHHRLSGYQCPYGHPQA